MKKLRPLTYILALALTAGLLLPTAALAAQAVSPPELKATTWLLMDGDHDEVLLEQDAHEKRYPASITKVMTAMLVLEAVDRGEVSLDQMVTMTEEMDKGLSIYGSTQNIKPGEAMSVRDLLCCLLITSANEAANILAVTTAGSLEAFVERMNRRAAELGCKDTQFSNAHGLHQEEHYTTAYDIYLFTREAMKHPTFREIVALKAYTVPETNLHKARELHSSNALISTFNLVGYYYRYAIGIKTGSTPEAGQCLVSAAEKDGRTLYAVVLQSETIKQEDGSNKRYAFLDSSALLDWGFSNTQRKVLLDSQFFAGTIPVTLSRQADYVGTAAQGMLEATIQKGLDPEKFTRTVTFNQESLTAPVEKGQVLGQVTVSYGGQTYGTLPLVAVDGVERSELLYRLDQVKQFFDQLWVKIAAVLLILVVLFFLLRWLLFSKRRRYGARGAARKSGYTGRRK